jgi:hypothetical protein
MHLWQFYKIGRMRRTSRKGVFRVKKSIRKKLKNRKRKNKNRLEKETGENRNCRCFTGWELPQGFADVPAHRRSQDFIALQYPFGVSFRVYAIPTNVPGRRRPNTADELFNNIRSSIANEKPDSGLRSGYGADRLRRRQVENAD